MGAAVGTGPAGERTTVLKGLFGTSEPLLWRPKKNVIIGWPKHWRFSDAF